MATNFWINVNTLIKSRKTTQEQICKETGISLNTLRGWVSKDVFPRADEAVKLSKALHTSVEYLVTGIEPFNDNSEAIELIKKALLILER